VVVFRHLRRFLMRQNRHFLCPYRRGLFQLLSYNFCYKLKLKPLKVVLGAYFELLNVLLFVSNFGSLKKRGGYNLVKDSLSPKYNRIGLNEWLSSATMLQGLTPTDKEI
jgi:hypothetical protein